MTTRDIIEDTPGETLYRAVGERIRAVRERRGLTQGDLAAMVDLRRTSITNIEQGRQRLPIATLYDIADALGVEAVELLPPNSEV